MSYWATTIEEERTSQDVVYYRPRLIVVAADSAEEAQRLSGLVVEEFHEATDEELDDWDAVTDDPLDSHELETLKSLVRRAATATGRRRAKDRERGRWSAKNDPARDANRHRAASLAVLLGKLEVESGEADVADEVTDSKAVA